MIKRIFRSYIGELRSFGQAFIPDWLSAMFSGVPVAGKLRVIGDDHAPSQDEITSAQLSRALPNNATGKAKIVDVCLPKDLLLARSVAVPKGAEGNINEIAQFDLLRKTPFKVSDIYWVTTAYAIGGACTQFVMKRSQSVIYRNALEASGFQVRKFTVEDASRALTLADFSKEIAPFGWLWRRVNGVLGAAACLLILGLWVYPTFVLDQQLNAAQVELDALRAQAVTLRREVDEQSALDATRSQFWDAVVKNPRLSEGLRKITVALPDEVWISDMSFSPSEIIVSGETSGSAADLVLQLTQARLDFAPSLAGAVSRTSNGDERFSMKFTPTELIP